MKGEATLHEPSELLERRETSSSKRRIIVIAGPTGIGKTDFSIDLARVIGGEIISADSMQVYRGMDIGTAKATLEQRREVPHHLIDIRDLDEGFNVVEFYEEAHETIREIFLRDHVPIIVGGSGFYLHVLLYGPPPGPPPDLKIRQELENQLKLLGSEALYERVKVLDPIYAKTITSKDVHKIVRALEVLTITKCPLSDFPLSKEMISDYDFRCWFLHFSREKIYERVERRCDEMLRQGFIEEVQRLLVLNLKQNSSAAQAIGYRQCLDYLQSNMSEVAKAEFIKTFKKASRNYVKRQFTWFKKETAFRFLNLDEVGIERAKEIILQDFEIGK